jgi:hypothetical protein
MITKTRDGRDVILHQYVPLNSAGHPVTFPLKGSILNRTRSGRIKPEYAIWRIDGRHSVFKETGADLVVDPERLASFIMGEAQ